MQGFLEERRRPLETLELGEHAKGLGAERPDVAVRQQLPGDRLRARPLPGHTLRAGRGQSAPVVFRPVTRRGQPQRLLGELGRDGGRAALGRRQRGVLQHGRHLRVGRVRRQREMSCAGERVVNDLGKPHVEALVVHG